MLFEYREPSIYANIHLSISNLGSLFIDYTIIIQYSIKVSVER